MGLSLEEQDGFVGPSSKGMYELRCIVCHKHFDFLEGERAIVLRHIAYGYDFVHPRHEQTALGWVFVDPEYDRPEFTHDARRAHVLNAAASDGWGVVMPQPPEQIAAGNVVRLEPLQVWALVEYCDGTLHIEGVLRDAEWETEPGGAEFPEGEDGPHDAVAYARLSDQPDASRTARWESIVHARHRGEHVPPERDLPVLQLEHQPAAA